MGSQFAPVLRSAVALQREWNYHLSFSPFTWDRSLHHRYVDNRILLISQHIVNAKHMYALSGIYNFILLLFCWKW